MTRLVILDAGPLGMVTNPRASEANEQCNLWLASLLRQGTWVAVPEIADYEVRRELLRAGRLGGLERLDELGGTIGYIPLTTTAMRRAAQFWAQARTRGAPTAADEALDADMILCGQAAVVEETWDEVVIATTNVGHLSLFVDARQWQEVR